MKTRALFFRIGLVAVLFFAVSTVFGAGKDTAYYRAAIGKSRYELKTALHNIIKDHTALKYDDLWKAFETTDQRPDNDTLAWDIYSNCDFPFYAHYGPNTTDECYQLNREHSFPNSWFGGDKTKKEPKYNDLFHMYPVSGRVNSIRNDNPYGKVQEGKDTFKSSNGSMLGPSATPGFEGKVFEPIDEYKGDLARTYFYMVTRYEDEVADWDTVYNKGGEKACVVCNGTSTQAQQEWAVAMFLEWHRQDSVSQKEMDRNDSIYTIQHNRNPFIDFPELVEKIWGNDMLAFGAHSTPSTSTGREPEGYYEAAYGKSGFALKSELSSIITKNHSVVSYNGLWDAFKSTDARSNGKVWDMYSDCDFTFGSDQCGNYTNECDCYNREHSFPKSWFNDASPMYSDLFHLYPTDGKVNGMRGNNPFGEVSSPTYTSKNGGKLGKNTTSGYSGTVFEPVDEYKGDFARSYFYMVTRYENQVGNWKSDMLESGNKTRAFKQWAVDLLLRWHREDPVSDKEIKRNDAVYAKQHNRNPFIDYPELVEKIWGNDGTPFKGNDPQPEVNYILPYAYLNAEGTVVFADTLEIYSSKRATKSQSLTIIEPENKTKIYTNAVAGKVRLDGFETETMNNTYSLKIVTLSYDATYTLETRLLKDGEEVLSASSTFETVDTVSVEPGHEVDPEKEYYKISYVYKDGEGTVLRRDSLFVEVADSSEVSETVASVAFARKDGAKQVLWSEDFEKFTGEDNGATGFKIDSCKYVDKIEGSVYAVLNGSRLASGSGFGQIDFKKFTCSGDFEVTVDGKGWSEEESTCKILCDVCTVKEQTLTFTENKGTLSNGKYEALDPVTFTVDGQTEVALSIRAESKKRVFIGKVEVRGEEPGTDPDPEPDPEPDPDPEPTPDTVAYTGITIVSPKQAEVLLETSLVARASLDIDDEEGTYHAVYFKLPEIELEYGGAYSLEIELWHADQRIDTDKVGFTVKLADPDPVATEAAEKIGFKLYPNPNRGDFYVDVPEGSRVEVFTSQGVLLKQLENVSGLQSLQLQGAGLYLVRVSLNGKSAVKRVVVK